MLGCHHAFMVAGALMAALRNNGHLPANGYFEEVLLRVERQARSGFCGLTGVCGIIPAVGACFSVLLGTRWESEQEQRRLMKVTAALSQALASLAGPSCCKAYAWKALEIARDFLALELGLRLPEPRSRIACHYGPQHPHGCRREKCPYFRL